MLIVALLALLLLRGKSMPFALGIALGTPLFFQISDTGVEFSRSVLDTREGFTVPVSVFALPLFLPEIAFGLRRIFRPVTKLTHSEQAVIFFCGWALIAFAWGAARGGARPLILLQVLQPLLLWVIARGFDSPVEFRRFLEGLVVACLATAILMVVSTAILPQNPAIPDHRLNDTVLGGFVLFQAWDYLPVLLVVAAFVAFGLHHQAAERREKYLAASAVLILVTPVLYSRGAMLTLLGGLVLLAFAIRHRFGWRLRLAAVSSICVLVVVSSAVGGSSTQRIVETLGVGAGATKPSDEIRSEALGRAVRQVIAQPVVGRAMTPTDTDPVTGVRKTVNAHNQYIDYAVRGGLPLMLSFGAILFFTLRTLWRRARHSSDPLWVALAAAVTAVACASNLAQVSFVQPLTAFPLWFLLGIVGSRAFSGECGASPDDSGPSDAELSGRESRSHQLIPT